MILSGGMSNEKESAGYTITIDDATGMVVGYSLINGLSEDTEISLKKDSATRLDASIKKESPIKSATIALSEKDQLLAVDIASKDKTVKGVIHRFGSPTLNKL